MRHLLLFLSLTLCSSAENVSYNQEVRPILSDKCFLCHGPDVANNKAGLRLDTAESAYAALSESSGHAIVPGNLDKSVAWQRIISTDKDTVMPPPESNLALDEAEKEILKRWIEQGAKYEAHWAFQSVPEKVSVPDVRKQDWVQNPIDAFVLAPLEQDNLEPSSPATPLRWLRRASFDLTGLPPSPEEIAAFEAAARESLSDAKRQAIDRLLSSHAYGEHMAVAWLDAARYADSYGYQSDQLNNQWPYRDWVVRAFNKNLPYDQFARWQIAGDLLDNPTRDQRLATAFNRLHRLTNEGGSIREEWLAENAADRLHTFGTAFIAMTFECSRCHDHKYDPISAREYYQMTAFFNSIDENGLYDHTLKVPSPTMLLPTAEQEARLENARREIERCEQELRQATSSSASRFDAWLAEGIGGHRIPGAEAHYDFSSKDGKLVNLVPGSKLTTQVRGARIVTDGDSAHLKLDGDGGLSFPGHLNIDRWTPFTVQLDMKDTIGNSESVVVLQRSFGTDVGYNGFDLMLEGGILSARLYRVWPGNGIGVRSTSPIPLNQWSHVAVTYDGSSQSDGLRLYVDGKPVATETLREGLLKSAMLKRFGSGHLTLGQRFRDRGFKGGEIREMIIHGRELSALEVRHSFDGKSLTEALAKPADAKNPLMDYFRSAHDPVVADARKKLRDARAELVAAEEPVAEMPIMEELPQPRETHVLARGEYDAPVDESTRVTRKTPDVMPPLVARGKTPDRLDLANWLTDPKHPLTARVFINRLWANFFGQGLVSTPENFGLQGALPSHPHLLDWLSREFMNSGWDIHHICRLILMSATYGQDSIAKGPLRELDPENRRLARGPSHRLGAEQIRDLALMASGLLDATMGGPPVSPYQPGKDLWKESNGMSPPYRQSVGKALHRRSLYSVWKRTAPLPNMLAFDSTTRETCMVSRARTNTPLQALVLLNDVQFVEAARGLAEKVHDADPEKMIRIAFLRLTGRPPKPEETAVLLDLHQSQLDYFNEHPDDAQKLIQHGDSKPRTTTEPSALAATTIVCQTIMNLDATIWKR